MTPSPKTRPVQPGPMVAQWRGFGWMEVVSEGDQRTGDYAMKGTHRMLWWVVWLPLAVAVLCDMDGWANGPCVYEVSGECVCRARQRCAESGRPVAEPQPKGLMAGVPAEGFWFMGSAMAIAAGAIWAVRRDD